MVPQSRLQGILTKKKKKSCNKEELTIKKKIHKKNKENSDHKWESKEDNQED